MDKTAYFLYYLYMQGNPIQFLRAEFLPRYKDSITRSFPDYFGLQYIDNGRMNLRIDDKNMVIHGNQAWCVYPGPLFDYSPAQPDGYWSHHYVTFHGKLTENYLAEKLLPFNPQPVLPGMHMGERMEKLRKLITRPDRQGQWVATNILEGLLLDLAEARTTIADYPIWLPEILQMLDKLLTGTIDYSQLAAEFNMTEHSLRRYFKAQLGVPIHTYVLMKKMAMASDLLRNSNMSIKEIARHLGYSDVYFFHRQFKQHQGIPPRQYRHGKI